MIENYLHLVFKHPKKIIFFLLLITGYFLQSIAYLSEDNNPYFLPQSHPARHAIYEMREYFTGTYDSVLVALYNKDGIYNQESLMPCLS